MKIENELTLNKIIYNIRTLIKDRHSDDFNFTDRNIEFWLMYLRAKLISQSVDKNRPISDNIKQTLYNVEVETVDSGSDANLSLGLKDIRTKEPIPKLISTPKGDLLISVYGIDGITPITIQPKARAIRNKYNKYASKFPVAYLDRGRIYLVNCSFGAVTNISVEGVFNSPTEVDLLNGLTREEILEKDYPIETRMLDTIHDLIKEKELNLFYQLEDDKVNDAQTIY